MSSIYLITKSKIILTIYSVSETLGYLDDKVEAEETVKMLNNTYKDDSTRFELIEVQKFNEKNMELF